MNLKTLVN